MNFNKASSAYTALGFELIGLIIVFVFIGRYLDNNYDWGGMGLMAGVTIAFVGWVTHLYLVAQMLAKQDKSGDNSRE